MATYILTDVSDSTLLRDLTDLVARDRATTAAILAHIAEVDARRLYARAGHTSMFAYCVEDLRLSEGAAYKRILAARAARQFPILFTMVAEARLHLTAVRMLAPHLTPENADELLAAAAGLRKSELELLLARRFPRPGDFATLRPLVAAPPPAAAPGTAAAPSAQGSAAAPGTAAAPAAPELPFAADPAPDAQLVPGPVAAAAIPSAAATHPGRFLLQVAIDESTREKLRRAQDLLGHAVPSGDLAQVLDRALDALISRLEQRKHATTVRPRTRPRVDVASSVRSRFVPAAVRRAVWQRDRGQCTFVGEGGRRCGARRFLEFDHVEPVARGGRPTVQGMRLRCRTHNRVEAERVFGVEFMNRRQEKARHGAPGSPPEGSGGANEPVNRSRDLLAELRELGFDARQAAEALRSIQLPPGASLEAQLRAALQSLRPGVLRPAVVGPAVVSPDPRP